MPEFAKGISATVTNSPSNRNQLWVPVLVVALLSTYLAQTWTSMQSKSATYDEQVYALAGYAYLETGQYQLKQDAPPLIPLLSGMAMKISELFGTEIELGDDIKSELPTIKELWHQRSFESTREYFVASKFFHQNDGPRLIQIARLPIAIIGLLLGLFLFRFANLLFGPIPALCALALFAFDPNMIGHGRVVSADLALACFFLISHYYLYRCLSNFSVGTLVAFAISVALCIGAKLSGLLVFPSLVLVTTIAVFRPPAEWLNASDGSRTQFGKHMLRRAAIGLATATAATWLVLSLLYGSPMAPVSYYKATTLIYSNTEQPYPSYLMGEFQPRFWYYYFFALLFKTPIPTVVFGFLGIFCWRGKLPLSGLLVCGPLAVVLGSSCLDSINIGVRRVLPAFPFLWLSAASFVYGISQSPKPFLKLKSQAMLVAGIGWAIWIGLSCFPNHLSHFSTAVGGAHSGYKYLAESNVSWGQNLPSLQRYLDENDIGAVRMHFYGFDDRSDYGITDLGFDDFQVYWPLQDVYVISVHSMLLFSQNDDIGSNWFERFEPKAIIGNTLYVFDLRNHAHQDDRTPEASLELARRMVGSKKYGAAVANFQDYLLAYPEDEQVHLELAEAADHFHHTALADFHRQKVVKLANQ